VHAGGVLRVDAARPGGDDGAGVPALGAGRGQPGRCISCAQARAARPVSCPGPASGAGKPKPGREAAAAGKAPAGPPLWRAGPASGPVMLVNSPTEPGQPWVMISGSAPGAEASSLSYNLM
jgi:hypothetical protein